jgi:hypothetical protein
MKSRFKNILRSITFGLIGVTSLFGVTKAQAATSYPIVNGQIVRFELSNGVALNIQNASLANDKPIYSFTGNNNDPEQHFKVISNGDGYNFQRNGSSYSLSASTLTPANLSPAVAYQSGFGQWQDFWLDDAPGNGYYLIKWRKDPNWCLNVPGSQSNVKITFFQCNAGDNDQRFRIVNIANQQYLNPMNHASTGVIESASGYRVSMSGTNTTPQKVLPNDNDATQKIQFLQVGGNQYVFQSANTNYALSSNTLDYVTANTPGMAMTTYTTGAGRWQNFGFVNLGGNWFQIKYSWNPNYCMSMQATSNLVAILPCNSADLNQKFRVGSSTTTFESWLIARYSQKANVPSLVWDAIGANLQGTNPEVGHNWVSLIKINKLNNAFGVSETYNLKTLSYWPNGTNENNANDTKNTLELLNYYGSSGIKTGIRKAKISEVKFNQLLNRTASQVSCSQYSIVAGSGNCTCVTRAVREWKYETTEDYTGYSLPDALADKLNTVNATGEYANNGNIIQ